MRQQENYNDLHAFWVVAKEKSFTKAAHKLGISQSALSRTIRQLETRLGLLLLTRTTRSLSLTQAGERLFHTCTHSFGQLDNELVMLGHLREMPSGLVRINAGLQVIEMLVERLAYFQQQYPDIQLELTSENRFVDIVAEGFDAGIRFGDQVAEDMIAVKISNETKMVTVATPEYFRQHGFPQRPQELTQHQCIGYRLSNGTLYPWTFTQQGETLKITPQGQWIFNDDYPTKLATKQGLGIAYLPEQMVHEELATGELIAIFAEYSLALPALYLYYPHRNISPALRVVIDGLRV